MVGLDSYIDKDLIHGLADLAESRICGFILYQKRDADVIKVLRDQDYWDELDSISGQRWPIFTVRPLDQKKTTAKGGISNGSGMLVRVSEETEYNRQVMELFGIDDSDDLPCFILFTWDDKDKLQSIRFPIKTGSTEIARQSLKQVVSEVAKAEECIMPEFRRKMGVFREASATVGSILAKRRFVKLLPWGKRLWDSLSLLK